MSITNQKNYRGEDFNNLPIEAVQAIELLLDAVNPNNAVRKSQAETISASAVQDKIVEQDVNASSDTYFSSSSVVSKLSAKQDNLSVHPDSTSFIEIVGNQIRVKTLTTENSVVDNTFTSLEDLLNASSQTGATWTINGTTIERGDIVKLENASVPAQERIWMNNGGTSGTTADFIRLTSDYNIADIRAMFSGTTYLSYDAGAGQYSLVLGTDSNKLGAQNLPMDGTKFQIIASSNDDQEKVNLALEQYIKNVDDNATGGVTTTNTRLDSLSGVTGNNMESFNEGLFPDNSNIKTVQQTSETLHKNATSDRASIRTEFTNADNALSQAILAEEVRALSAEASETSARQVADIGLQTQITANSSAISAEQSRATGAEGVLSGRLDIVEGDSSTVGSIAHGVQEAENYADAKILIEKTERIAQVNAVDTKVNNLQQGDIKYIGKILVDGTIQIRQAQINAGDTRNGQSFTNISLQAGETFVADVDLTVTYTDGTAVAYEKGDKFLLTEDVTAGALVESNVNAVPTNDTGLSLINIGSSTIEIDGNGYFSIIAGSIGRTELATDVKADIDDKRSLTLNNAITSPSDTHFVVDALTDAAQNVYWKRTSNTSDALTGTKRTTLTELYVSSLGSGNPLSPSFAHASTTSTFYNGTSTDMSMAIGGGNFEANVVNPTSRVLATGVYALAQSSHLGINSGLTGIGQNAGISNIGVTGFGKAGGAGKDRGGVFALSDYDFINYAGFRSANPISYPDVALVADAGTAATGKAFVAVGDSIFEGGSVTVPSASADTDAVNLGDIKNSQYAEDGVIIAAGGSATIAHGLGTEKIDPVIWVDNELNTSGFKIERSGINSAIIYNGTNLPVTIDVLIKSYNI